MTMYVYYNLAPVCVENENLSKKAAPVITSTLPRYIYNTYENKSAALRNDYRTRIIPRHLCSRANRAITARELFSSAAPTCVHEQAEKTLARLKRRIHTRTCTQTPS